MSGVFIQSQAFSYHGESELVFGAAGAGPLTGLPKGDDPASWYPEYLDEGGVTEFGRENEETSPPPGATLVPSAGASLYML